MITIIYYFLVFVKKQSHFRLVESEQYKHACVLSCCSHFYINTRKSWIFCFVLKHTHTLSFKTITHFHKLSTQTRRKKKKIFDTHTSCDPKSAIIIRCFVKDKNPHMDKKEEIKHLIKI